MATFTFNRIFVLGVTALIAMTAPRQAPAAEYNDLAGLVEAARTAGPDAPDMMKMAIAPATSKQLLRQGDIDFHFSVGIDLPIDLQPQTLSATVMGAAQETGRYVIVFDVAMAKASRKVRDVRKESSRKVVDVIKHENPAYKRALVQLDRASQKVERFETANKPVHPKIAEQFGQAQSKLTATPPYLEQPVYGSYEYKAADTEASKTLTVNYYVIDKETRRYVKSTFDVVENQHFVMAYNLEPTDPDKDRIHSDHSFEKDVRDWERAAIIIPLSHLLDHALRHQGASRSFASAQPLLEELARDRSAAAARLESERFDARPLNDPRFDSVVAIFHPKGMGSGFYVRSNIVLTNWHVVEGTDIVEIKRYDGRETFGQVIGRDVRLDLALVKVQDRGRPVEFMTGKDVKPGEMTEVIGHPVGYAFSVTRGVVSAIRRLPPALLKTKPSEDRALASVPNYQTPNHKDGVLYIQTDAAINHGNSGGPMFMGNKVVGISDWGPTELSVDKQAAVKVPGIAFAVHYSEATRFITDALKGE
ncbi:Trypsin-like serine proteases, typically periplasmic, contain C-terminal PDZ domain [Candidatus Terasakiella magnetica]|nr:Trypsin-like serine proteases, typically periplasmic, contain C-terminal PDZ domain [Candidatus Terasakiella magnetica]